MINSIVGVLSIIPIYFIFLFCCYLGLIIAVTLFPIPFNIEIIKKNKENIGFYNNFIPFKSIWELITDNPMYIDIKNIL